MTGWSCMSDDRVRDALVWLEFAVDDLDACRSRPGRHLRPRHVANLAQQAAEKALKAALVLADKAPPKTHDLELLRSLLPHGWRSKRHPADLERLSSYGVRARYPDNAVVTRGRAVGMLIAWQALNKLANPYDRRFSTRFLIVTPGARTISAISSSR